MGQNVICRVCRRPIYTCLAIGREYTGAFMRAEDLIPLDPQVLPPEKGEELKCPICGEFYAHAVGGSGGPAVVLELEDGAFWPHPPI